MILIELTAAIDAAGTLQTFYFGNVAFATKPTDTPANVAFIPALIEPGSIGISAFSDRRTGGATKLETGEIILANADGALDALATYSFDGRPVVIRSGSAGAYPAAFPVVLRGTVESVEADWSTITLRLRDKQFMFRRPALSSVYAGNNALPSGLEGTANDLAGRRKPKAFGKVFNVSPPLVNTSRLIYETGICNTVDATYDRGVLLTAGAVYASQADMETNAPAAGQYRAWPAGGYIRLGSTPAGQITADLTQGATAADRTVAQILKQLAITAGLTAADVSAADVTALDAASAAVVGIWLQDDITYQAAMDQVASSIGAYYGFDSADLLRMGRLSAPAGTAAVTLYDYDIHNGIERRPPSDKGLPVWRATVKHSRIWTVQASDLAGSVTADRRAYLANETRAAKAEDAAVKTQWMLAGEAEFATMLTASADAATEVSRLLDLYKVQRELYEVPVTLDVLTTNSLRIMDVVSLVLPRFGMAAGKLFRLLGIRIDLGRNQAVLTLWG